MPRLFPIDEEVFSSITDESAYWIGFLLADGNVYLPKGRKTSILQINLQADDVGHLEKFKEFTNTERPLCYTERGKGSFTFSVSSNKLAEDLEGWGVTSRKSGNAKAHPDLANNSHFWRGVIDGDGSYVPPSRGTAIRLAFRGTEALCSQFLEYVNTIYKTRATVRSMGSIYQVEVPARHYVPSLYAGNPKYCLVRKREKIECLV